MRVILLVIDGFGIGSAPDSGKFFNDDTPDTGCNTLYNIARTCFNDGSSYLHNLSRLGLADAFAAVNPGKRLHGIEKSSDPISLFGAMKPNSAGKDSPSGHWEICGQINKKPMQYFKNTSNSIPNDLLSQLAVKEGLPGFIGNCKASGTEIVKKLGAEHLKTGKLIVYTSADSVIQIAAHEEFFGLNKLYQVCLSLRKILDQKSMPVGRVIARPFNGNHGNFTRTGNRKDFAIPPNKPTLLDQLGNASGVVYSFGKISDIFAGQGIHYNYKDTATRIVFRNIANVMKETQGSRHPVLLFANFGDFDNLYGHRRDPQGYADALCDFDERIEEIAANMDDRDVLAITSDHGNDPTWVGGDHTREYVPIIAVGSSLSAGSIGIRKTYADLGQSIASLLRVDPLPNGDKFFQ